MSATGLRTENRIPLFLKMLYPRHDILRQRHHSGKTGADRRARLDEHRRSFVGDG